MGNRCVNTGKEEISKNISKKQLERMGIQLGDLSKADIIAIASQLLTNNPGMSVESLFGNNKQQFLQALSNEINRRTLDKKMKQELESNKIGNAEVVVANSPKKGEPRANKDTLYIFPESLQAYNEYSDTKTTLTLITPKSGVRLNVSETDMQIRTDTNGDLTPNAVGLVVSKNAQNEDGRFITSEEEMVKRNFQNTKEDFEEFTRINTEIIQKIKERLLTTPVQNSPYTKVQFPSKIAYENESLPKEFADWLSDALNKELGINSQVLLSDKHDGYYIAISQKGTMQKKEGSAKNKYAEKNKQLQEEMRESLKAERPLSASDAVDIDPETRDILTRVFPDIEKRKARVDFVTNLFSDKLTNIIDTAVEYYKGIAEEDRSEDDTFLLKGLTSGTTAEQRLFALKHLNSDGMPLAEYIFEDIRKYMQMFTEILDENGNPDKEAVDVIVDDLLLNENTIEGQEFREEANNKGWKEKYIRNKAIERAVHLAVEFNKMLNDDVFTALLREMAFDLEFNENIRLDISGRPVETGLDIERDDNESSGENPNREGYMIKYKLVNPITTLSTRMKTFLASMYKLNYSSNGITYAYDDLGRRVRMNPSVVYYILLDEFSKMNKPEDLDKVLSSTIEKYPWMATIQDTIMFNPKNPNEYNDDLRREFYTAMRMTNINAVMITPEGTIKRLNRGASAETFLATVTKNYEGGTVFGENSIYNENGEYNETNVEKLRNLVKGSSGLENNYYHHPLIWVKTILQSRNSKAYNVANLIRIINLLNGRDPNHKGISLEKLLNNLGVDTSNMNLHYVLPNFEVTEEEVNGAAEQESEETGKEVSPLDIMERYFTPTHMRNIDRIIQAAINITREGRGENSGYHKGDHLVTKFQSSYLMIANSLTLASEGYTQASFMFAGNSRFTYVAPDFISELVGNISNMDDIEGGTQYIMENYGRFDWFRDYKGNWNNTLLEMLFESGKEGDYATRRNFEYYNVLGFGGNEDKHTFGKVNKPTLIDNLICAYHSINDDEYGNKYGVYRSPLFSDTDGCVLLKLPRFSGPDYKQKILNRLVKVAVQEIDRASAILTKAPNDTKIEHFDKNGRKFQFFPELDMNKVVSDLAEIERKSTALEYTRRRDSYLAKLIDEQVIQPNLQEFLDSFSGERLSNLTDKITRIKSNLARQAEDADTNDTLNEAIDLSETSKEDLEEAEISKSEEGIELLTEYFYNDFFMQSQIIQLYGTDIAYFKNFRDFIKRNKQVFASGLRIYARDENGNKITEKCMYAEDLMMVSNSWSSIKDLLNEAASVGAITELERDLIKGDINSFKNINSTDGQSLRTLNSFRKIYKAMGGKWTDDMEAAYQRLKSGQVTIDDFRTLWNPIKPFLFGYEAKFINGRWEKVMAQHKNSEYMLTAVYSLLQTALNKSPELIALNEFMDSNDIDVLHFHSVVKEGWFGGIDLNYDKESFDKIASKGVVNIGGVEIKAPDYYTFKDNLEKALSEEIITQEDYNNGIQMFRFKSANSAYKSIMDQMANKDENGKVQFDNTGKILFKKDVIHEFPLDSYMIVQPTEDHLTDQEAIFGSQLRNIVPADLPSDFKMTLKVGNEIKELSREEAVELYNTLFVDNYLDAYNKVDKEFSDIKRFQEALFSKMRQNPKYGEDIKAALQIDSSGTSFEVPFNSPNLNNKIEELILSTFKNAIQKQKIKGGNAVLVSNYGLSDNLKIKYKNDDALQGIEYIPCYMPATSRDIIKDYLEEKVDKDGNTYWTVNFEELEKHNPEILDAVGYRIPTEDKYSIMPIRIIGFLPEIAGATIMLPTDIINMSGTDFDIDKLFIMLKATRREIYNKSWEEAYKDWIKKGENKYSEEEILQLEDNDKEGYTSSEVGSYKRKYKSVKDFFRKEGYKHKFEKPIYRVIKPKTVSKDGKSLNLSDISLHSSKEARDNMMIDIIRGVLTSKAGTQLSLMPGGYKPVSQASRQQRILHNKAALTKFIEKYKESINKKGIFQTLMDLSTKELENFYDENASTESPLSIITYANNHRNLMDGNDLIGMLAVSSSNHYKFQFLNLTVNDKYKFKINGQVIEKVDPVTSPLNGMRIGRICSWFQAASPDNGKDPTLGDLGLNQSTVNRVSFLARIGLDPASIGIINTLQDKLTGETMSFLDYCSNLAKIHKGTKPNLDNFSGDISKITQLVADFRTQDIDTFEKSLSSESVDFLINLHYWIKNINELSQTLQETTAVSRSDSPNGSLNIDVAGAVQQHLKAMDFIERASSPECPIKGLTEIVDIDLDATESSDIRQEILKAKIPRLQAAYTLGIKSAMSLSKRYLPQLNDNSIKLVEALRLEVRNPLTSKANLKVLKKFFGELTMYLLSKDSIFSSDLEGKSLMEKRNYYIHDFPIKFSEYLNAKDAKGNFIHKKVRNLDFIKRLSNVSRKGIYFFNVGKVSTISRKHYVEGLNSMLYINDEAAKVAQDLFMYAYYDNGLNFGHSNYGIFFNTFFLKAMPRYIKSLKKANNELSSDKSYAEDFVYQFILNHPEVALDLKQQKIKYTYVENEPNTIRILKDSTSKLMKSIQGRIIDASFVEFVRIGTNLYRYSHEGYDLDNVTYVKVDYNKTKAPYYDATTYFPNIKFNELKERGAVGKVNEEKQNKKETKSQKNIEDNMKEVREDNMKEIKEPTMEETREPNINAPQDFEDGLTAPDNDTINDSDLTVPTDTNQEEPENLEFLAEVSDKQQQAADNQVDGEPVEVASENINEDNSKDSEPNLEEYPDGEEKACK